STTKVDSKKKYATLLLSLINSIFSQKTYLGNILADYQCAHYCAECPITNLFHGYEISPLSTLSS
ncbi:hypothetical protein ACO1ZJ_26745, partial [Klebsiella pneumoniae]|uniref:hypothetical protein n=1 Tax=Klebsiella pneumoniae TaxID=573 RepID=UPI003BF76148